MSDPKPKRRRPSENSYLRYSGMAFQMIAAILICLFFGRWLDAQLGTEPLLLVVFALLGVFVGLYYSIKDFL